MPTPKQQTETKKKPGRKPQSRPPVLATIRFTGICATIRNFRQRLKGPNRITKNGTIPNWSLTVNVP